MELKVPHVLSSADDPPLIDDVTILSSSTEEEKSAASVRAIVPAETASVESWEVGDAVCWTKGDDEMPNDAIGRVLRLHSGKYCSFIAQAFKRSDAHAQTCFVMYFSIFKVHSTDLHACISCPPLAFSSKNLRWVYRWRRRSVFSDGSRRSPGLHFWGRCARPSARSVGK